MKKEKQKQQFE